MRINENSPRKWPNSHSQKFSCPPPPPPPPLGILGVGILGVEIWGIGIFGV